MTRLCSADTDQMVALTRDLWGPLDSRRVFITGGTGFVGCWLIEAFTAAHDRLGLRTELVVLTRDPEAFERRAPHLALHPSVRTLRGDVRDFAFPEGSFSHVIHAATDASRTSKDLSPTVLSETIVDGTGRVLEFASRSGAQRLLFVSSGAVYGPQPAELTHVGEEYSGSPGGPSQTSAYADGKRAAERLCSCFATRTGINTAVARCFAFVGPYLPLDAHYAIGNFVKDALRGGPIRVKGDGTPYRSYLYGADLAVWLWTILVRGGSRAYNVGSETAITISELASLVARAVLPHCAIEIEQRRADPFRAAERYVPSTRRALSELGLSPHVPLDEGIGRMAAWYAQAGGSPCPRN